MTEAAFFESSFDSGTELWQALISTDKCKLDIVKHLDSCPFLTSWDGQFIKYILQMRESQLPENNFHKVTVQETSQLSRHTDTLVV